MTEDVPFYVELAREADGPVVELAVGTGRVAIPVARDTGKRVLGFDLSPAMLAVARERVAEAGVDVELHEQDMRDFALDEPAALVYCPFRALLHLSNWPDRRRVFERVAAALRPGGRFAWNTFVFDPIAQLYDPWSRSVTEDVGFYVAEARKAGGPVVELGVGTGRIAVPIAAQGVRVIGVDDSAGVVEACRSQAP